eukprot:9279646-Alexandrium_andersonii.AAC.1
MATTCPAASRRARRARLEPARGVSLATSHRKFQDASLREAPVGRARSASTYCRTVVPAKSPARRRGRGGGPECSRAHSAPGERVRRRTPSPAARRNSSFWTLRHAGPDATGTTPWRGAPVARARSVITQPRGRLRPLPWEWPRGPRSRPTRDPVTPR